MEKSLEELQKQVDLFNGTFGIGCKVDVEMDNGDIQSVTVSNKATFLGGHSAVGWFEEISGCYSLDRVCDSKFITDIKDHAVIYNKGGLYVKKIRKPEKIKVVFDGFDENCKMKFREPKIGDDISSGEYVMFIGTRDECVQKMNEGKF